MLVGGLESDGVSAVGDELSSATWATPVMTSGLACSAEESMSNSRACESGVRC